MRIALTGNPNSGKTTMYNALTGRNERVGNWAGVTVEKKESPIKKAYFDGEEELIAVDLPGAYSMSPFTSEESITSAYVKNENPDVIINIVDAANLSRSLFFTTQLLELGIPVVVALNKSDITEKKKTEIDVKSLSQRLGCPVVQTISTSSGRDGLKEAVNQAAAFAKADVLAVNVDFEIGFDAIEFDDGLFALPAVAEGEQALVGAGRVIGRDIRHVDGEGETFVGVLQLTVAFHLPHTRYGNWPPLVLIA